jgi:hypothetical protein
MKTIETIGDNGEITLSLEMIAGSNRDFSLVPGRHKVVIVIEEELYEKV